MSHPNREDIDDRYTFDLTRLFDSPEAWEREYDALAEATAALRERVESSDDRADTPEVADSGEALLDALESVECLVRRRSRLELYARLRVDLDTEDGDRRTDRKRAATLASDVREVVNAARREVARVDPATLDAYRESTPELAAFDRYLDDVRRRSAHVRSAEVESVLATVDEPLDAPVRVLRSLKTETFDPPTVERPDGERVTPTMSRVSSELRRPDRDYRRRVYEAYVGALDDLAPAFATAIGERYGAAAARAEARNFGSVREMAFSKPTYPETGLHQRFPPAAHDAMLDGIRSNLGPHHRLLERRREALGVGTLRPWDLRVPLAEEGEGPTADPDLPYDRARELIVEAVAPLGADYQSRLADFLDERRVDVYEAANKRDDVAYCPSSYDSGAFVLLNYQDDLSSAFTLAHELGHAMHVEQLREANRPLYATGPRPVEEVPSLLHELLLADHLHTVEGDVSALATHADARLLDTLDGNLYNAARTSLAMHEHYGRIEGGESLSLDRLAETYTEGRREFHAPVEYPEDDRYWLGISHDRAPYHYYQYVLGATGALVVADRLREGSLSPEAYGSFLESTGRRDAVGSFAELGLDVTTPAPFERATETFADYVDRVERR
ncbi:M3 family oligoendopeptidase [Halobium salinum]|uniref:M3 family oligoendopeptidase n=1 Tax=Halobium salinum TaxID=1364940 RepID=A0ABD5PGV8_9EURY|nr:M3 family metallopeptidase [Halobium salinum]